MNPWDAEVVKAIESWISEHASPPLERLLDSDPKLFAGLYFLDHGDELFAPPA